MESKLIRTDPEAELTSDERAKLKISIAIQKLEVGGTERSFVNLAKELKSAGFNVEFLLFNRRGGLLAEVEESFTVKDLGKRSKFQKVLIYWQMRDALKASNPSAVVALMNGPAALFSCIRKNAGLGIPTLVRFGNNITSEIRYSGEYHKRFLPPLLKRYLRFSDRISHNSRDSAKDLAFHSNLVPEDVQVIPWVLRPELRNWDAKPAEHPWLREKEKPVIITAGRLSPQKDHANLIHAIHKVRKVHDVRCIIYGEGEDRATLEQLVDTLGLKDSVSLPGRSSQIPSEFGRADVFVLSSRYEGLPNVVGEAMMIPLPIVSTDCETGPRELLNDGEYGKLVPIEDADALAAALIEMLENPFTPPEKATAHLMPEVIRKQWFKLFDRLCRVKTFERNNSVENPESCIVIKNFHTTEENQRAIDLAKSLAESGQSVEIAAYSCRGNLFSSVPLGVEIFSLQSPGSSQRIAQRYQSIRPTSRFFFAEGTQFRISGAEMISGNGQ